jgi:hypothetical protein
MSKIKMDVKEVSVLCALYEYPEAVDGWQETRHINLASRSGRQTRLDGVRVSNHR